MSNESLNDCRRDFEAWYKENYATPLHNSSHGYKYYITQRAWKAWKACWELQDARVKGCLV